MNAIFSGTTCTCKVHFFRFKRMNMNNVKKLSDLTPENLTKIFQYHFQDDTVRVQIASGNDFSSKSDHFQSEMKCVNVTVSREGSNPKLIRFRKNYFSEYVTFNIKLCFCQALSISL